MAAKDARSRAWTWLGAVTILAAVLLAYAPLRTATFVWDDDHLVYESPLVRAPDGLARFWLTREAHDYFPLTNTTFWLEWRLWGMDARGYHATNVALHAATAILVWRILLRLGVPAAWLIALLFALHPVSVASVAWIAERKNTLSTFLAGAALLAWLRFDETRTGRWPLLSWLLFLAALLAKTSVVGLPVVMLLCVWWRRGRIGRDDLLATAPFFAAGLVLAAITVQFQYGNVVTPAERALVRPEGLLSRVAAAGWCVWFYLDKSLWPTPLAMIHPRWEVDPTRVLHWLPLAALLVLAWLAWRGRERGGRAVLLALGCAVALLGPVLGLFAIYYFRYSLVAEHWLYPALVPLLALVVAAGSALLSRLSAPTWARISVALALAVALGVLSFRRAESFESAVRLFEHDVAIYPDSAGAHFNLGVALERAGRPREARRAYLQAVRASDRFPEADSNYARLLVLSGDLQGALHHYQRAAAGMPHSVVPVVGQATVLVSLGRRREAIALYRRAVEMVPRDAGLRLALATALAEEGEPAAAREQIEAAIAIEPGNATARTLLADLGNATRRPVGAARRSAPVR